MTIHNIAVEIFKLVDGGFHKDIIWPSDEANQGQTAFVRLERCPTPFCLLRYSKPEQYPDGIADLAGYWAEDRIFGGVVLFGRGTNDGTGVCSTSNPTTCVIYEPSSSRELICSHGIVFQSTYDGIWFHSHRDDVTERIYALTEEQTANLLQFLGKGQVDGSTVCPLPILGDITNRRRVDQAIAIPEFNVYRDRWERTVDYRNWKHYRFWPKSCVRDRLARDWPNRNYQFQGTWSETP